MKREIELQNALTSEVSQHVRPVRKFDLFTPHHSVLPKLHCRAPWPKGPVLADHSATSFDLFSLSPVLSPTLAPVVSISLREEPEFSKIRIATN